MSPQSRPQSRRRNAAARGRAGARGAVSRGLAALAALAMLVVASHLTQRTDEEPGGAGRLFLETPLMADSGPAGGTQRLALRRWSPADADRAGRPSVLLLHGSPGSGSNFERMGPLLAAAGYDVIAPDLPGFGGSTERIPSYSIIAHARAMHALLDSLEIERAHVVGWSQGGGVALHMADLAPERVASLTLMASIGVQEAEGSGSYVFEHLKYGVGYVGLVLGGELLPHFGLLGSFDERRTFIRNFWDTDQRPLRGLMERLETPTLILHGRRDFLTPAWGAEVSHELIAPSTLVVLDATHFMPFIEREARLSTGHMLAHLARHDAPGAPALRQRIVLDPGPEGLLGALAAPMARVQRHAPWWLVAGALASLAFAGPEAAAALAGVLVSMVWVDAGVASAGLLAGLAARSARAWRKGSGLRGPGSVRPVSLRAWEIELSRARFATLLGTRLQPWRRDEAAAAARATGLGGVSGVAAMACGCALWTAGAFVPALVAAMLARVWLGEGVLTLGLAFVLALLAARTSVLACTWTGRQRIKATISRASHHEFWPAWVFYTPLVPWLAWLGIRHGGVMSCTCANPTIGAGGGVVGESKIAILRALAPAGEAVLRAVVIEPGEVGARVRRLAGAMASGELPREYPIVLKPDSGQRGYAVRIARSAEDARDYLARMVRPVVAQAYHPGPVEIGCMWMRSPDARNGRLGRVFSITTKHFSELLGDGRHTVEQLIYRHRRFRCQADTLLTRLAEQRLEVPASGERVRLVHVGNHAQGAMFRDGSEHITPELEAWIDRAAAGFRASPEGPGVPLPAGDNGLDFGRFDIRAESLEHLRRAEGLAIIELNGTAAESTNIYDPDRSVWWAWGVLLRQWAILYRLGARRRGQGVRPMTPLGLLRAWREFDRDRPAMRVAE